MDVTCPCGTVFQARSPRAKYHSDACRKRAQRGGGDAADVVVEMMRAADEREPGGVYAATLRELTAAERENTALGQACLQLARRLDSPGMDTGSAMASVALRLDDLLAKATKGAGKATSPGQMQDELEARRRKHA